MDDKVMMLPPRPARTMDLAAAWATRKVPRTLTFMTKSKSSREKGWPFLSMI